MPWAHKSCRYAGKSALQYVHMYSILKQQLQIQRDLIREEGCSLECLISEFHMRALAPSLSSRQ